MSKPRNLTSHRRIVRTAGIVAGVIVLVVTTAYVSVQWIRLTEPAAPGASVTWTTAPDRPAHSVMFDDLLGKQLSDVERLLGISTGKITLTLAGPPVVVAVPDDGATDGLPPDQLTATAICASPEKSPPQTIYIGVTPTTRYDQDVSRQSPAHLSRLAELTGCDPKGFVGVAVYDS
ncbi:Uncharacterised protein [Nocardia otitidiscaviarum]|uniref:Uncharacterized protein n=1 Tax=Nocardia otitidiscaviarum TaxID=1823 RepID=A0A378YFX5_9NOCA|nr:hypothetical protein [Nocardia otitidiscaviarum]SUA76024.1 Uncharacterised protein [Nocardia otitidiscaviarum]